MDYIYGKIKNTLMDLNNIKSLTLLTCTEDFKPIETLVIGDYYLELEVYDSDIKIYCDLSALNEDKQFILNTISNSCKEILDQLDQEHINVSEQIDKINEQLKQIVTYIDRNVENLKQEISTISFNLQQEKEERIKGISKLTLDLETEKNRVDSIINQLNSINSKINYIINQLNNNVFNAIKNINEAISAEISDRQKADEDILAKTEADKQELTNIILDTKTILEQANASLLEKLNEEVSLRTSNDTVLQSNIDAEERKRLEEDTKLSERIDNLDTSAGQVISDLRESLNQEITDRQQAISNLTATLSENVKTLTDSIETEQQRAVTAEEALNTKITAESTRAVTKEEELQTSIDAVDKDLQDKYTHTMDYVSNSFQELTSDLLAEGEIRKTADDTLTANLQTEQMEREEADQNIIDEELRFTKTLGTTVSVGGIAKGTTFSNTKILDILNNMLYPYVAFSISNFTTSPNGGTYECGSTVSINNSVTNISLGSEQLTSIEILDSGVVLASKTSDFTGSSFTIPITTTVSANKYFTTRVKDDRTTLTRNSGSFTFVYPYYYGSLDSGVLDEANIKSLTKVVQTKGNKTFRFTHNNKCCVIAYPASYGNLRTIIDQNNFDITSSFIKNTVSITGLDGTSQNYNVYVNSAATLDNFGITFNF